MGPLVRKEFCSSAKLRYFRTYIGFIWIFIHFQNYKFIHFINWVLYFAIQNLNFKSAGAGKTKTAPLWPWTRKLRTFASRIVVRTNKMIIFPQTNERFVYLFVHFSENSKSFRSQKAIAHRKINEIDHVYLSHILNSRFCMRKSHIFNQTNRSHLIWDKFEFD